MKFNLDLLHGKSVINCRTKEQAEAFIGYLDELNGSKSSSTCFDIHEQFTGYRLTRFGWDYCNLGHYRANGYKILSFEEVLVNENDEFWYKDPNNFPCIVIKTDGLYYETWGRASHYNSEVELCVNNEYWSVKDWKMATTDEIKNLRN